MDTRTSLELLTENQRQSIVIPIPQSTNIHVPKQPMPKPTEFEQSRGASLDVITIPQMQASQPYACNGTPYKSKATPELSSAATLADHVNIPVLSCEEFKQEGSDIKQNYSNRSIPSEPFWPMIRRRDKDPKGKKLNQRPSVERSNNQSELKREQEKLRVLKDNLELEFGELEAQKNRLEDEKRQHEEYLSSQRTELEQQMTEIQKKRESLFIKQKILERNDLLSSRKFRDANRCKLELFCYKLTHALKLDQWAKSVRQQFIRGLTYVEVSPPAELRASKKLIRVKSCEKLRESKGRSIKYKSRSPANIGNSLDKVIDRKQRSTEHKIKPQTKNLTKRHQKKCLKKTKSSALEPQPSQLSKNKVGKPSKL